MYKIQPIEYRDLNTWVDLPYWKIYAGNSQELYFRLIYIDPFGERRHILSPSEMLKLQWVISRPANINSEATVKEKIATSFLPEDRSFFRINLDGSETRSIISGGVGFSIIDGISVETYKTHNIVKVIKSDPGF